MIKRIKSLGLEAHPEGGAFRETYRTDGATSIQFLLQAGEVSAWHRVTKDELWFFHEGAPLHLKRIDHSGRLHSHLLGLEIEQGQYPQVLIPAGHWQAAIPMGEGTLVSCVVIPAFDFMDFAMADEAEMQRQFPDLGDALLLRP